ncbi:MULTISPECIES: amino acid ABC transporter ATP-binding protein [unclassified Enterococcus]|uniref:amino acid ABC transporter ATP-binding protein n=1 Tax=unclassified Enterococcus TaxID=2608891 RepID=UPI001557C0FB|nr:MULTISPECIES: amino acid ABC transporter ATP-binding protein [unclassified Enterococcus]MBS7576005.1 amino acid ABC transporter ATP-binding protein [Enterococcus sp. MMGLQ5-2]MBS7583238.1 amino acid ABC transporter ATP-binding protein [Enterococcus sp. MMGLQ5-1]NPD11098.1 amino acid ABC transporter ATP-binding protein [Enterococcus sp. MMGLQ5-1]NPD35841.1 amino acid ABC transporter ATP-binding protein [Enterococcus sp. MMGLQ5-2]
MLELKNINKSFGSKEIFKDLNLVVNDGDILAIVGQSGGGKTTLLRMLAGLETIDSGEVFFNNQKVENDALTDGEQIMGVVFQDFQLFPHLTVFDNLTISPLKVLKRASQDVFIEAKKLLEQLGIDDKSEAYPYQLSGGQKQRVALARALMMHPKIIGYDEPTSALDPALRKEVENLILSGKESGITQIVVTHDMAFAENISNHILEVTPVK